MAVRFFQRASEFNNAKQQSLEDNFAFLNNDFVETFE